MTSFDVNSAFGFDLSSLSETVTITGHLGGVAGIGLGNNSVLQASAAPVNNAVPYLYFTINPLGMSATNVVSIVCDPAGSGTLRGSRRRWLNARTGSRSVSMRFNW